MPAQSSTLQVWFGCLLLVAGSPMARAANPAIAFDFGRTAECQLVTPADSAEVFTHQKQKLVELRLRVSVHLLSGSVDDVEEVRIEIGDCDSRIRVHSFEPSTTLENRHSEDIYWSRTTEQSKSLGATLGGEAPMPLGEVVAHVTPSISGGTSNREVITETEHRLPPKHVVVASGTIGQEHGVFFKLRSSPLWSLEGVHELTIRFIVSDSWRGDSLRVCCRATGQERFLWMKQQTTWANTCAPVAIYLAGDLKARQAAQRFVEKTDRS